MNNEPVAWMLADKEAKHIRSIMAVQHDFVPQGCVEIPLYTHPVKELDEDFDAICLENKRLQAEIEALKERLEDTNSGWLNATKTACTAQAEIKSLKAQISSLKRKVNNEYIRAELALANKKLTDKEITEIYFDDPDILVFARAILKKAQE